MSLTQHYCLFQSEFQPSERWSPLQQWWAQCGHLRTLLSRTRVHRHQELCNTQWCRILDWHQCKMWLHLLNHKSSFDISWIASIVKTKMQITHEQAEWGLMTCMNHWCFILPQFYTYPLRKLPWRNSCFKRRDLYQLNGNWVVIRIEKYLMPPRLTTRPKLNQPFLRPFYPERSVVLKLWRNY